MKYKLITVAIIAALSASVSGCKTLDAYTGEQKTSSTTKGGAIGAGIGALIGYISARDKSSRDRRKAILVGAGVGGVTGAGVGAYMDKQEAKLRDQLEGTGVSVTRNGDEVILNMPGNITFATGKSTLQANFGEVLDSVVLVLNEFNQTLIEVAGHTDSVGSTESNQKLSYYRATSVGNYLIDNGGISFDRVMTVGRGEGRPIADNKTTTGRAQNRRVELTLIPVEAEG
ncbi:MAG: OmpA family protein [Gammaproteobacteria bacterium]|jgi:outer membrane protein OmpA-like peptidoglycan-associated protein|nr:OmpA family protein [Gammaproteobacteria bacterium]MBT3725543.1 OmpA family protein [Gammaproteobacteria bacterium]MBT4075105.1 OmpA family protein [Gammaproteobacteria bacterium]MBT4194585.1 OmpA family protein [Gammaproteobacteria bacterium]MBT4448859.1 OmpA family protein [Gammaproteobacteria bacterium]